MAATATTIVVISSVSIIVVAFAIMPTPASFAVFGVAIPAIIATFASDCPIVLSFETFRHQTDFRHFSVAIAAPR